MIPYEAALESILTHSCPLGTDRLELEALLGCVLAEPVVATCDLPMFDNSAVDGFGICEADVAATSDELPVTLDLIGVIQAGDSRVFPLRPGSAIKILTGAPVPPTVAAVVMKEFCLEQHRSVCIDRRARMGENIRRCGQEFAQGAEILPKGTRVTPAVLGLLATLGHSSFMVYKKPRVAVVSTGNELVRPGDPLQPGQIYDSNSYALVAAVKNLGIDCCRSYHARDDKSIVQTTLVSALADADVVISAGGVSVGDYDFVRDVAEALGVKTVFWKTAIKPGKPVYFGTMEPNKLIFGLPGNPVSALVTFHQFVKPALLKIMGCTDAVPLSVKAILTKTLKKKPGRLEFVRGTLGSTGDGMTVSPTSGQESHMMGGLAEANCLIYFPVEASTLDEGTTVNVELIDWSGTIK